MGASRLCLQGQDWFWDCRDRWALSHASVSPAVRGQNSAHFGAVNLHSADCALKLLVMREKHFFFCAPPGCWGKIIEGRIHCPPLWTQHCPCERDGGREASSWGAHP